MPGCNHYQIHSLIFQDFLVIRSCFHGTSLLSQNFSRQTLRTRNVPNMRSCFRQSRQHRCRCKVSGTNNTYLSFCYREISRSNLNYRISFCINGIFQDRSDRTMFTHVPIYLFIILQIHFFSNQ